jgi:HYR domain
VTYSVSATDPVDGPLTPVCTPASGSTFPPGTTTVTCTATDTHGNTATGSFQVQVQYAWSGILQPINADGSSVFKLGSVVPVKFQLTGASAGITNATATLSVAQISSNIVGTDMEALSTSAATTGNAFRYDSTSGQYIFNLATKGLSKGSWRLSINLQDGVSRTVTISLR